MSSTDPQSDAIVEPSRSRNGVRNALLFAALTFAAGIAVAVGVIRQYSSWMLPAGRQEAAATGNTTQMPAGMLFQPPPEAGAPPTRPIPQAAADPAMTQAREMTLSAQIAALEARAAIIDRDSRAAAGSAARAEALLVAFAARRATDQGLVLGYVEDQLRLRFGAAQPRAVATIVTAAKEPVTLEELRLGIDTLAPDLTTGSMANGWWPSLQRELAGLVVIRKEGTPSPRPADRLDRIRRLIDSGRVEAAMAEVARLPGARQAGGWTRAATRYVETHRALDLIEMAAIAGPAMPESALPAPQLAPSGR